MSVSKDPDSSPQADLNQPKVRPATFFVVSPRKLLLMELLSQGFYTPYWMYRHWQSFRDTTGAEVLPLARASFSFIFIYELVMNIQQALDRKELPYRWRPRCLAAGWATCAVLPYITLWFVSPLTLFKLGTCLIIIQVLLSVQIQRAVNHLESDPQGKANSRFTWANAIWIAIGLSFFVRPIVSMMLNPTQ